MDASPLLVPSWPVQEDAGLPTPVRFTSMNVGVLEEGSATLSFDFTAAPQLAF